MRIPLYLIPKKIPSGWKIYTWKYSNHIAKNITICKQCSAGPRKPFCPTDCCHRRNLCGASETSEILNCGDLCNLTDLAKQWTWIFIRCCGIVVHNGFNTLFRGSVSSIVNLHLHCLAELQHTGLPLIRHTHYVISIQAIIKRQAPNS